MEASGRVSFKVKHLTDTFYDIEENTTATIADIKKIVEQKTQIPVAEQKLIFKGKVLKDNDTLAASNVEGGSTLILTHSKGTQPQCTGDSCKIDGTCDTTTSTTTESTTTTQASNPLSGFNGDFNDPNFQSSIQGLLADPQALQGFIASNPAIQSLLSANPALAMMINDPMMLQMFADPQILAGAFSMLQTTTAASNTGAQSNPLDMLNDPNLISGLMGGLGLGSNTATTQATGGEFQEQLAQLEAMGFANKEVNIKALKETNGNVEQAVEKIMGML